ncbi:polysaccharide pyruvyl transferase family protein [Marinobacter nauticus]|uniref:polysaccharide pyruvyl transferase family protein n=1 Tax=Marinobacter nauticus TaxID=2743 RepID=UPI001CFD3CF8|nr:polysaccharide pyruvyl transferase family protein [Marinobacter nauticus]
MKILKLSPIYGNNSGDLVIARCIEHAFSNFDVQVDSVDLMFRAPGSYKANEQSHRVSLRSRVSSTMQLVAPRIFYVIKKVLLLFGKDKRLFREIVSKYDAVMFGGGNLLMNSMGCDYIDRIAVFSEITKSPVIIFCVGAGPFLPNSETVKTKVVSNADVFTVRDKGSLAHFSSYNLSGRNLAPDPAFIVSDIAPRDKANEEYLGVNLISGYVDESSLPSLAERIAEFARDNRLKIRFINTSYPYDGQVVEKVKSIIEINSGDIEIEVANVEGNAGSVATAYSNVRFFLGCRMHSLIFALSHEIPSIGFAWDDKVPNMFDMVFPEIDRDKFIYRLGSSIDFEVYKDGKLDSEVDRIKKNFRKCVSDVMQVIND